MRATGAACSQQWTAPSVQQPVPLQVRSRPSECPAQARHQPPCNSSAQHAAPHAGAAAAAAALAAQASSGSAASRRSTLATMVAAAALATVRVAASAPAAAAATAARPDPALIKAFEEAMAQQGNPEAAEHAWTRAIELAPTNSAAWSNRGTARLQAGRWADAYADLAHALELESTGGGRPSALLLNNLGNAEGALGRWEQAMEHYAAAAEDPEMESIARANYALAAFEIGRDGEAVRVARQLLRRDPQFLDMRAALTAFLWSSGQSAAAEEAWEALQQANDGLGGALYSRGGAVARVRARWPPRATAALGAFLALSDKGSALGYDGQQHEYEFRSRGEGGESSGGGGGGGGDAMDEDSSSSSSSSSSSDDEEAGAGDGREGEEVGGLAAAQKPA